MVKNHLTLQETWVLSPDWKIPWRREWQPTPVFLPGESRGQRSLAIHGITEELDTTEHTHTHSNTHTEPIKERESTEEKGVR